MMARQTEISDSQPLYRGKFPKNWPYVNQKPNGQYEGFCIDLLNELAPLMGVAYTLSLVPDGQYGGWVAPNGSINGMIGQVMRGDADFAIGDLTVLSNRARFVDFTNSFMDYGLAALMHRDIHQRYGKHIRSFKDLSEQTDIKYGVKKHGANLPLFHDSPVVAKMYSYMDSNPSVFVHGEREGLERIKRGDRYAFLVESTFAEYVVQRDCDLIAIDDRRKHFQFEYAIAVRKNSGLKERFNKAIRQLRLDGKLHELKDRYWLNPKRNCPDDPGFDPNRDQTSSGMEIRFSNNNANNANNEGSIDQHSPGRLRTSSSASDQLRTAGGFGAGRPYHHHDDEDVELIKPKPDTSTRINHRRPINRRNRFNSASTPTSTFTLTSNGILPLLLLLLSIIIITINQSIV